MTYLVVGAHPDDPDLMFGGCAVHLARLGHRVLFVSATNGNAGHFDMNPKTLAKRRKAEAVAAARVAGIEEYRVMDTSDGCLEPSLENRFKMVAFLRRQKPDVVITHRLCDYHADHRATSELVRDAVFFIRVPLYCSGSPVPDAAPILCHNWDAFTDPVPFRADVCVDIDKVVQTKLAMLDCHASQFYEWLPWLEKGCPMDIGRLSKAERLSHLESRWLAMNREQAKRYRRQLRDRYGRSGNGVRHAESFEISPYGRHVSPGELAALLTGL